MIGIMNKNDWDHNVEGDAVEGPVVSVSREEVLQALNEIRKSSRTFIIITIEKVGIKLMAEICQ